MKVVKLYFKVLSGYPSSLGSRKVDFNSYSVSPTLYVVLSTSYLYVRLSRFSTYRHGQTYLVLGTLYFLLGTLYFVPCTPYFLFSPKPFAELLNSLFCGGIGIGVGEGLGGNVAGIADFF